MSVNDSNVCGKSLGNQVRISPYQASASDLPALAGYREKHVFGLSAKDTATSPEGFVRPLTTYNAYHCQSMIGP